MPGPFDIITKTSSVQLDDTRSESVQFDVVNTSGQPIRGRAWLVWPTALVPEWIKVEGEVERDFAVGATQQYIVRILAPPTAKPGNYGFRFDMLGVQNPDEDVSHGPPIEVTLPAPPVAPKGFPIWIPLAAVAALLVVAAIAFLLIGRDTTDVAGIATTTAVAASTSTAEAVAAEAIAAEATAQAVSVQQTAVALGALATSTVQAGATQTAIRAQQTWISPISLFYRQSSYGLRLVGPGEIKVVILESQVAPLRVLIVRPDSTVVGQQDGTAPFDVSYTASAADVAMGDGWSVVILDTSNSFTHAEGRVQITYPSGSRTIPFEDTFRGIDPESEHTNIVVLKKPGRIQATAEWGASPASLNLAIRNMNFSDPLALNLNDNLALQLGGSPLSVGFTVSADQFAVSDTYPVHLYNSTDSANAIGKLTLSLP